MTRTPAGHLLRTTFLFILGAALSYAATPVPHASSPKAELAAVAQVAVERGLHANLPPHVSTLLGLTQDEQCPVLQGVLRSTEKVEGIEVTEKNHDDIVIFTVDEATKDQTFYLTSPSGTLRRVLLVKQGVGHIVKPMRADTEAFQKEKDMWKDRLAALAPAK